jgi:hypothetical protein
MTRKRAHALGGSFRSRLLRESALTDAALAGDQHKPTSAHNRIVKQPPEVDQLSAYERRAFPGLESHGRSIIAPVQANGQLELVAPRTLSCAR